MPVKRLGNRDDLLNEANFKEDPSASNRIWIAGKPLEEWIEAKVGASRCTSVCGDSDCRTVEVNGKSLEVVLQDVLIKAALKASKARHKRMSHGAARNAAHE